MPDNPELQWIPDAAAQAIPVRTRVVGVIVFAAIFLAIGFAIGRLTARIPGRTNSRPPEVVSAPSTKKPVEYGAKTPSLALKSETEETGQKPAESASERKLDPPPVILGTHGAIDKNQGATPEETRAEENRTRQATGDQTNIPPARDYKSLREYMFSR
jgi:hypothetical protein